MSCIYSNFNGYCQMYDKNIENSGWDEKGTCICEDDEDPGYLCEMFEPTDPSEYEGYDYGNNDFEEDEDI